MTTTPDPKEGTMSTTTIQRHREGIFTVRDDNGEASIRCELCPTKMMNGAGTKEGLSEQYAEHVRDEHLPNCRYCSEPIEWDDGADAWVHGETGFSDCVSENDDSDGFHACPWPETAPF